MDAATLVYDIDSSAARTAATDLLKMERAATKLVSGFTSAETAQNRFIRNAKGQFESRASVVHQFGASVDELARQFNPAMANALEFERAQQRLATAVQLGVVATDEQAAAIRTRLVAAYEAATAAGVRFSSTAALANAAAGRMSGARGIRDTASAVDELGSSSRKMGAQVQNAGYQVGDFFVQIASGQSASIALAQQLPQLLGGFGALGAVLGAAVAIGGAAYTIFSKGAKEAANFEDAISNLSNSIQSYRDNVSNAQKSTIALVSEFGLAAPRAREMYEALAAIERIKLGNGISESLGFVQDALKGVVTDIQQYRMQTDQVSRDNWALEIQQKFGLTVDQANRLADAVSATKLARGPIETAAATARLTQEIIRASNEGAKLPPGFIEAGDRAAKVTLEADRLVATLGTAPGVISQASGQTQVWAGSMSSVLSYVNAIGRALSNIGGGAIQFASQQAEISALREGRTLQQASIAGARERARLESKEIVAGLGVQNDLVRKGLEIGINATKQRMISQQEELAGLQEIQRKREADAAKEAAGGGGKGGGAAARRAASELKAAEKGFQSLRELMEKESIFQFAEYEKRQTQLETALQKRLLTEQQYETMRTQLRTLYFGADYEIAALQYQMDLDQLKLHLDNKLITEQEYQRKRREMQWQQVLNEDNRSAMAQDLSNTASYFGQLNSLTGSSFDSLLKLQQTFQAASALLNAYTGASQVLADPTVPFWLKIAAAGKVLAAGIGFVAAIKGGGRGGSSGGGGASPAPVQETPTRQVLVRLEGDDWLVGMADSIMRQIYEESRDGRVIIARDN